MDKQNQANKNIQENLSKGNAQERQFGQDAQRADKQDFAQAQNKLDKGAQGIAREQEKDIVGKQAKQGDALQQNQGIDRDAAHHGQGARQEVGKDQEWAQRREKDAADAPQDKAAQQKPAQNQMGKEPMAPQKADKAACDKDRACDKDQAQAKNRK